MTIRNIKEAQIVLRPYVPLVKELTGKDITLERMWPLMKLLGNPQDQLKIIHIAGTSGKSSTAYYMESLLSAAGLKTGLMVSPYVDSITERAQINGRPLSEAVFCQELGEFLDIIEASGQKPSYFELLYAFSLWVFVRQKVDYAVIETGLGGLHDATNVATRPDKVCVITDIGLDHQHVLGDSLPEIAAQKAGIIHEQNHVFMYRQASEITGVVEKWSKDHSAVLHLTDQASEKNNFKGDLSAMPDFQQRNWLLAYVAYRYLQERDNLTSLAAEALLKTQSVPIPGRMEVRQVNGKTLIMDGAHNAQKISAFLDSFMHAYPGVKPAVLIALKEGKEFQEIVPLVQAAAGRVIVTSFDTMQDVPVHSMDPEMLARAFEKAGVPAQSVPDQSEALKSLLNGPEEVCVITGSFYLLGQIRQYPSLLAQ